MTDWRKHLAALRVAEGAAPFPEPGEPPAPPPEAPPPPKAPPADPARLLAEALAGAE